MHSFSNQIVRDVSRALSGRKSPWKRTGVISVSLYSVFKTLLQMCILGYMQRSSGRNTAVIYDLSMACGVRRRAVGQVSPDEPCTMQCFAPLSMADCTGFIECHPSNLRPREGYLRPWLLSLILDFHSVENLLIKNSTE